MTNGHSAASLILVVDFRAALLAEGTVLFLLFVLLAIGWVACRELLLARARAWLLAQRSLRVAEPAARRVLRIGFGVLWIIDGLLQAQPAMPGQLASQVITPAAAGSPGWVGHVVHWSAGLWAGNPVQAAAGAVWIQLGLGIWLVSVSSPRWSRLAGLASAGWGVSIWVFGEAFGGVLAPAASWLTGAPGAALFYIAAGMLLAALPVRCWREPWLGRHILRGAGVLLAAAAVAQAWPGSGFWQGTQAGPANSVRPGPLPSAIASMAQMRQPAALHDVVSWFAGLTAGHGFAVNLVVVVTLAVIAAGLLTGRAGIARPAAGAAVGFCLADWVLVQDIGIFGGVGTDPNSMVPQALILTVGVLAAADSLRPVRSALTSPTPPAALPQAPGVPRAGGLPRAPGLAQPGGAAEPAAAAADLAAGTAGPPSRPLAQAGLGALSALRPGPAARRLSLAFGTAGASAVLTVWAVAMVLMGAAPLAAAAVEVAASAAAAGPPGPASLPRPTLASAALTAESLAARDLAGPGGAGLVRSGAGACQGRPSGTSRRPSLTGVTTRRAPTPGPTRSAAPR